MRFAAGGPLNWDPAEGDRPSRSTLAAGLGTTRAIREGFLRAHQDTVIIPVEFTRASIYHRVADLTYDAQLYFVMAEQLDRGASPETWAGTLQRFLHDQQQALPPDALRMRWVSNHDTVSGTFQKRRPLDAYGAGRMRALLALCALVEGVPMLYQGDEDPAAYGGRGLSSVEFLRRVYAARKSQPALRDGRADYESVRATGGVLACLRSSGDRSALGRWAIPGGSPTPFRGTWRTTASRTGRGCVTSGSGQSCRRRVSTRIRAWVRPAGRWSGRCPGSTRTDGFASATSVVRISIRRSSPWRSSRSVRLPYSVG